MTNTPILSSRTPFQDLLDAALIETENTRADEIDRLAVEALDAINEIAAAPGLPRTEMYAALTYNDRVDLARRAATEYYDGCMWYTIAADWIANQDLPVGSSPDLIETDEDVRDEMIDAGFHFVGDGDTGFHTDDYLVYWCVSWPTDNGEGRCAEYLPGLLRSNIEIDIIRWGDSDDTAGEIEWEADIDEHWRQHVQEWLTPIEPSELFTTTRRLQAVSQFNPFDVAAAAIRSARIEHNTSNRTYPFPDAMLLEVSNRWGYHTTIEMAS